MSILSSLSGIHISKKGIRVEPLKAVGTLATLGSFGALSPVAGAIGGIAGKIPMVGGLASKLGSVGGLGAKIGAIGSKIGGLGNGAVGKIGGFIKDNPDALLSGLGAIEGYNENKKANNLQNEALNMARSQYADRAPLREMGMQQFQNLQRPDLSGITYDPGNPYAKRIPRVGGMR